VIDVELALPILGINDENGTEKTRCELLN